MSRRWEDTLGEPLCRKQYARLESFVQHPDELLSTKVLHIFAVLVLAAGENVLRIRGARIPLAVVVVNWQLAARSTHDTPHRQIHTRN